MTDKPPDWAEAAQRAGVDPADLMQRAAAQMKAESEQARAVQEHGGAESTPEPTLYVIVTELGPKRWKMASVGKVGGRDVEAFAMSEAGCNAQFRYKLAHALQANLQSLPWDHARAQALRYRIHVSETIRAKE